MKRWKLGLSTALCAFMLSAPLFSAPMSSAPMSAAQAAEPAIARGEYLVRIGGCTDCHTPGHFMGHPDPARFLGGSDVGFGIPGDGVFVGPNLTPDKDTGLGAWTEEEIATAITTGVIPGGRILAPAMPWRGLSALSKSDALAMAAYLKSLPPVSNKVPGPFGPTQTPTVMVMSLQPGAAYMANQPRK
ncbi:MAG TPA: cytochrome c [Rhodopila sp.]|nr:cytochrome c [Rhodopila sp.]